MARAPFNVVVYSFRLRPGGIEYAIFRRSDEGWWQGVSGGGEAGESPLAAAIRETREETGVTLSADRFTALDATEPIPVPIYRNSPAWGEAVFVIPQYGFGCRIEGEEVAISGEHRDFRWVKYEEAVKLLRYSRIPLWELNARLLGAGPRGAPKPP